MQVGIELYAQRAVYIMDNHFMHLGLQTTAS